MSPDFALGISFGSGELRNREEVARPLNPVVRGAIIGCLAFFGSLIGSRRITLADGSPAKDLFWDGGLRSFFAAVARWSDVVVFVVPTHLKDIGIKGWGGETQTLVLPETRVHELWPAVLPYCAGRLAPLLQPASKISIFVQAAATSVPIALLVSEMARAVPGVQVKCYDFGQVLDVALFPHDGRSWSKRPDVWSQMTRAADMPLRA